MKPARKQTARERAALSPIKQIQWHPTAVRNAAQCGPFALLAILAVHQANKVAPTRWKRIPQATPERKRRVARYNYRLKSWKKQHPFCEAMVKDVCTIHTKDCHHLATRIGEKLLDEDDWLPVCRACHDFIGNNKSWARQNGLLK